MEIITGYVGKKHVTSEQERDVNQGIVGPGSYVLKTGMQMEAEVSSNNEIKIRDGVLMHQGCAASIKKNTYDSLTIINGSQGMKRVDLIVARYEKNRDNETESLNLEVIQGTPAESNPAVPKHTEGDIQAGDYVADMPLYQVIIDGLNITEVKKVFETVDSNAKLAEKFTELNGKIKGSVAATDGTIHYVKIGNVVTFSAEINTANGSKEIATMPFKPIIKTWCGVGFSGTPSSGNWAVLNTDGTLYISKAHSGNVLFITGTYICV